MLQGSSNRNLNTNHKQRIVTDISTNQKETLYQDIEEILNKDKIEINPPKLPNTNNIKKTSKVKFQNSGDSTEKNQNSNTTKTKKINIRKTLVKLLSLSIISCLIYGIYFLYYSSPEYYNSKINNLFIFDEDQLIVSNAKEFSVSNFSFGSIIYPKSEEEIIVKEKKDSQNSTVLEVFRYKKTLAQSLQFKFNLTEYDNKLDLDSFADIKLNSENKKWVKEGTYLNMLDGKKILKLVTQDKIDNIYLTVTNSKYFEISLNNLESQNPSIYTDAENIFQSMILN
jgi:hypothetical protein